MCEIDTVNGCSAFGSFTSALIKCINQMHQRIAHTLYFIRVLRPLSAVSYGQFDAESQL